MKELMKEVAHTTKAIGEKENVEQLFIVDLDNPEGDVYKTDLEDAKNFLCNIWQENEGEENAEILEEVHECTTIAELNDFMNGCDYEVMTEAEHLKYIKEYNCNGYDETCTCITCQDRRELVEERYNKIQGLGYGNDLKALQYAEKYGVIDYEVSGDKMIYFESYPNEGTFKAEVNLDTMKEIRTRI